MQQFLDAIATLWSDSGIAQLFSGDGWKNLVMIAIS